MKRRVRLSIIFFLLIFSGLAVPSASAQDGASPARPGGGDPQGGSDIGGAETKRLTLDLSLDVGYLDQLPTDADYAFVRRVGDLTLYRQEYEGVPIYGTQYAVEVIDTGLRVSYRQIDPARLESGEMARGTTIPQVSEATALDQLATYFETGAVIECDLFLLPLRTGLRLVWRAEHRGPVTDTDYGAWAMVDAHSGKLLGVAAPQLAHASSPPSSPGQSSVGQSSVGQVPPSLQCPPPNPQVFFHGVGRGVLNDESCFPATKLDVDVIYFTQMIAFDGQSDSITTYEYPDPVPSDPFAPISEPAEEMIVTSGPNTNDFHSDHRSAVDAHTHLWMLSEYWQSHASEAGLTEFYPNGRMMRSIVDIPSSALGESLGAAYAGVLDLFLYGPNPNNESGPRPVGALDIVAHEFGHAILRGARGGQLTQFFPMAVDEAFSDVVAVLAEAALEGGNNVDWTVGEDIGPVIRDLRDPKRADAGDTQHAENFFEKGRLVGSIHEASTVISLAMSLLSEGGAHPNASQWPSPTVNGVGRARMERILYKASTELLHDGMTFTEFAKALEDTAKALYPGDPGVEQAVRDAFRAVGIADAIELAPFDAGTTSGSIPAGTTAYFKVSTDSPDFAAGDVVFFSVMGQPGDQFKVTGKKRYFPWLNGSDAQQDANAAGQAAIGLVPAAGEEDIDIYFAVTATTTLSNATINATFLSADRLDFFMELINQTGEKGKSKFHKLEIPDQQPPPQQVGSAGLKRLSPSTLEVTTSGGVGNVDLYLKHEGFPSPDDFDVRATGPGNNHTIRVQNPDAGEWFVALYGEDDFSGVTLLATYGFGPPMATRGDGHFPSYTLGDTARMTLTTDPPQAGQRVYGWRTKDGVVERDGEVLRYTDASGVLRDYLTDANGTLVIELPLPTGETSLCGNYSNEQFAVGAVDGLRSSPLAYTISCPTLSPPSASRPDGHFPGYELGDHAIMRLVTDPPQPFQKVYGWRLKNGVVERNGEPLRYQDTNGIWRDRLTDASGVLEVHWDLPLDAFTICGTYTDERFAVGSANGARSAPLSYTVSCPALSAPSVSRPDGHFPSYTLGDVATMRLTTNPPQPFQRVFGWRVKDGQVERDGEVLRYEDANGTLRDHLTDAQGTLEIQLELPLDATIICGSYTDERFAVGSTNSLRSASLAYTVSCP